MKRLVPVALLGIGWVIGYVMPRSAVLAQTPAAQGPARGGGSPVQIFTIDGSKYPRALNGKGVVWTREELKAKYLDDPNAPSSDHLQWAPPYRLTIQRRRPPTNASAPVGSELHDDKTQIYIIIGGSGTVLLGGKPEADNSAGPGRAARGCRQSSRERRGCDLDSAHHLARLVRRSGTDDDVSNGAYRKQADHSIKKEVTKCAQSTWQ
jgi:hypothetical protein